MTTILTKKKDTSGAPSPGDLTNAAGGAELAVNTADKRLYTKDSGGNIVEIGTNPTILNIDNIQIDGNTISSTNSNGNINITPNGTGSVVVSKLQVTGGFQLDGNVTVGDSSADTLTINSTITSNLIFTDNTYDIGASGATRPRSLFLGTNLTVGSLTSTRVPYASTGGLLVDSANMTFNGTKLTVAGFLDSALTSGRVPYATTSGELTDSANLLYSGTDLTIYGITVGRGAGAVSTNTAVGASALAANTTGTQNTAIGNLALNATTTGANNAAFGAQSLRRVTTAQDNTAIGTEALRETTTGSSNTSVGSASMILNTTGANNTALGYWALFNNTTASNNTAVGYQAGYSNTTGAENITIGTTAGYSNTTGTRIVAIGHEALYSNTVGSNVAVGWQAGRNNTTGGVTALGYYCLRSNTTGTANVAIGDQAMAANTTGGSNVAVGNFAGISSTVASNNTFIGYAAGYGASGSNNTFIGWLTGYNSTGSENTFVGNVAGNAMTTGIKNTILGRYNGNQGGLDIRTANNYIVLSDGDGNPRFWHNGTNASINSTSGTFSADLTIRNIDGSGSGKLSLAASSVGGGGASSIAMGNNDSGGTAGPNVIVAANRNLQLGRGNSFSSTPGTVTTDLWVNEFGIGLQGNQPSSGIGLAFPATQSASSNANTLDDYEEGTWTPTLIGSGGASGQSYDRQVGKYTKIGNVVYCSFDVQLTNRGTLSGVANIGGLPFTPSPPVGSTYMGEASIGYFTGLNTSYVSVSLTPPDGNVSQLIIRALTAAATASTDPQATDFFTNATRLIGGVWYFTSSQ